MISKSRNFFLRFIFMLIISAISLNLYSRIVLNRGNDAFIEPSGIQSLIGSSSIGSYIVSGAGYFLAGNSEYLSFLNEVETSVEPGSVDFKGLIGQDLHA